MKKLLFLFISLFVWARLAQATIPVSTYYYRIPQQVCQPSDSNPSCGISSTADYTYRFVSYTFNNGGSALATGQVFQFPTLKFGGTLVAVELAADAAGSCTVDLWRQNAASGSWSSTNSIIGGSGVKPTLTSAAYVEDSSFTNWTSTTFSTLDVVTLNLATTATIKYLTVTLVIRQTS